MPVVINDLEVVMESAPAPGAQPQGAAPGAAPALTPLEIAELLERRARQELRLFAH
jgi:hypothetical protein